MWMASSELDPARLRRRALAPEVEKLSRSRPSGSVDELVSCIRCSERRIVAVPVGFEISSNAQSPAPILPGITIPHCCPRDCVYSVTFPCWRYKTTLIFALVPPRTLTPSSFPSPFYHFPCPFFAPPLFRYIVYSHLILFFRIS